MTPREADVAFVLEGLEGVVSVQVFHGNPLLDFAIGIDGARAMARAHNALLRVLTHEQCRRVLFYYDAMPSPLALRAHALVLGDGERAAARARVPSPSPVLEPGLPPIDPTQKRILVVDDAVETANAVASAAPFAMCVVEPDLEAALTRAKAEPFDMFVCDAGRAFGPAGFLERMQALDALGVTRVTLVTHAQDLRFTMDRLERLGRMNSVLVHPLDVQTLSLAIQYGGVYVETWRFLVAPARTARPLRRVLVVDDDDASAELVRAAQTTDVGAAGLTFSLAKDVWEALELASAEWDAILCSVTMKTESGVPVYRVLWNNRPDLKRRFAFLAWQSAAVSGVAHVVTRPLSIEAVAAFLDAFEPRATIDPSLRILVVDDTAATATAVATAAPEARRVVEPDPAVALARAKAEPFDVFLCDSERAFGPDGFLVRLQAFDPLGATRVMVVTNRPEVHLTVHRMERLGCIDKVLVRPLDVHALTDAIRHGYVARRWTMPVRGPGLLPRRILVIDDDPASARLVKASEESDGQALGMTLCLAKTGAEARARMDTAWDAVVCSVAMKTEDGVPMYRMLWNDYPAIKRRFAFLVAPDSAPVSGIAHLISRPLTLDFIGIFLDAFERR